MVTQKLISLKIDYGLLDELDSEVGLGCRKRNWHINQAIRIYLTLQDCRRTYRCVESYKIKAQVLNEWLREQFPEAATW